MENVLQFPAQGKSRRRKEAPRLAPRMNEARECRSHNGHIQWTPVHDQPLPVRVAGKRYYLWLADGPVKLEGEDCEGVSAYSDRLIIISNMALPESRLETFWHEFGHVMHWAWKMEKGSYSFEDVARLVELILGDVDSDSLSQIERYLGVEKPATFSPIVPRG